MGTDKALLEVDGQPMARRVADALAAAGAAEVLAQGGDEPRLRALDLAVRADREPGGGPLPATLQAVEEAAAAGFDAVVVLSCDLLAPSAEAIRLVLAALDAAPDADAAVPVVDGPHQWTHAAWPTGAALALRAAQEGGARSLRKAAAHLVVTEVVGLSAAAVADADAPGDLSGG
jgi:molybdopterin-guanine dinucleotide biosynthesis protein A